jgi:hypothetical protein
MSLPTTLSLLRLDPFMRGLPRILIIYVFSLGSFIAAFTYTGGPLPLRIVLAALWGCLAFYLFIAPFYATTSDFPLSLPLSAHRLWLTHVLGCYIGAACLLVGCTATSSAVIALLPGTQVSAWEVWVLAGRLAVSASLGLALVAVFLLPRGQVVYHWFQVPLGLLAVVGILVLAYGLETLPVAVLVIPVAAALGLLIWRYNTLPMVLTLAPSGQTTGGAVTAAPYAPNPTQGWGWNWFLVRTLLSVLNRHPVVWVCLVPVNGLFGFLLAGQPGEWPEGGESRFDFVLLTAYIMVSMTGIALARLGRVGHLPISPRLLTGCVIMPIMASVALGYSVGEWGVSRLGDPEMVKCRQGEGQIDIFVPLSVQRVAWDGRPPVNISPTGEEHAPWSVRLLRVSDALFYNPYSIPKEATADFAAWQISRALEAVYGRRLDPEQIKERYLETAADGTLRLGPAGFSPRRDFLGLEPVENGPIFPVMALLTGLVYLGVIAALLYGFSLDLKRRWHQMFYWLILGSMLVMYLGQMALKITGWAEGWALNGVALIYVDALGRVPGATVAVWILCPLVLGVAYRGVKVLMRRCETRLIYIAGESNC